MELLLLVLHLSDFCSAEWFTVDHFRDMQKTVITLQGRNSEMAAQMEEDKNQTAAKMKELQEQHNATVLRMQNKLEELEVNYLCCVVPVVLICTSFVKRNSLSEICLIVPFLRVLTVYKATQSLAYLV